MLELANGTDHGRDGRGGSLEHRSPVTQRVQQDPGVLQELAAVSKDMTKGCGWAYLGVGLGNLHTVGSIGTIRGPGLPPHPGVVGSARLDNCRDKFEIFYNPRKAVEQYLGEVSYQRPGRGKSKCSPGEDPHPAVAKQHCPR